MFSKKTKKKGFTLVEMLVVIAIIAILVSIVMPVIGNARIKAAAATNAANLRSVEGQISAYRVTNSDMFQTVIQNSADTVETVLTAVGFDPQFSQTITNLVTRLLDSVVENPDSAISNYAKYKLYNHTAENGVLTIQGITIENVPVSERVVVGNMNMASDVQMTVYITETAVIASYEYDGKRYTKEDFAVIAETGDFTGTASGGKTEDDLFEDAKVEASEAIDEAKELIKKKAECAVKGHPGRDANHNCTYCGEYLGHEDTTGDGICDVPGCSVKRTGTKECGCTQGKTISLGFFGSTAGKCENVNCGHNHKEGEKCSTQVDVWE